MPVATGLFRPSVIMPADADTWSESRLRVVLLHELAHVKRRDCLTHVLAQAACAFYWFNPLAWLAVKRARAERERACDDLVLACGTRGSDYADLLLEMARVLRGDRFPALLGGASLAMAHRSQLEGRLMAILDPRVPRSGLTRARALAVVAVAAARLRRWPRCSPGRRTPRSPRTRSFRCDCLPPSRRTCGCSRVGRRAATAGPAPPAARARRRRLWPEKQDMNESEHEAGGRAATRHDGSRSPHTPRRWSRHLRRRSRTASPTPSSTPRIRSPRLPGTERGGRKADPRMLPP